MPLGALAALILLSAGTAVHAQDIQLSVAPEQVYELRDCGKKTKMLRGVYFDAR